MTRLLKEVLIFTVLTMAVSQGTFAQTESADPEATLSLAKAERLALLSDPKTAAALARARAFAEQSVASGQLKDPQLRLGLINVPIDDFDIQKNPTTQFRIGIMQQFPSGNTRELKTLRDQWLSNAENATAEVDARTLLRTVREIWLDIWYQQSAQLVIAENRDLFKQLVNITEGQYASGRAIQQDVLRADLELSRLDDRLLNARRAERGQRGRLMRWVGGDAQLPLPASNPELAVPDDLEAIAERLTEHPVLKQKSAQLEAQERNVEIARAQYKPAWSLGGEYRERFGENPDGSNRESMFAITASIDLPFFTAQRQDKK
ncbi:MAG: TolC family protein, partial [Xanthomonadales bacterium]|nr:TolC family protein [Xanthomonadales bacterium]